MAPHDYGIHVVVVVVVGLDDARHDCVYTRRNKIKKVTKQKQGGSTVLKRESIANSDGNYRVQQYRTTVESKVLYGSGTRQGKNVQRSE
jgi:hypothetical protein